MDAVSYGSYLLRLWLQQWRYVGRQMSTEEATTIYISTVEPLPTPIAPPPNTAADFQVLQRFLKPFLRGQILHSEMRVREG